jgi:hypothetical protein
MRNYTWYTELYQPWAYADPLLARLHSAGQPSRQHVPQLQLQARHYDLWSLGITLMEIYDDGRSLFSDYGSSHDVVRENLLCLTQTDVEDYVNTRFGANDQRLVRKCLKMLLKVDRPEARAEAKDILRQLLDVNVSGVTDIRSDMSRLGGMIDQLSVQVSALCSSVESSLTRVGARLNDTLRDQMGTLWRESQQGADQSGEGVLAELTAVVEKLQGTLASAQAQGPALDTTALRRDVLAAVEHSAQHSASVVASEFAADIRRELGSFLDGAVSAGSSLTSADMAELLAVMSAGTADIRADVGRLREEVQLYRREVEDFADAMKLSAGEAKQELAALSALHVRLNQDQQAMVQQLGHIDANVVTMLRGAFDIPTLVLVLPFVEKSRLRSALNKPLSFVRDKYQVFFVCEQSFRLVPCGPQGEGYTVTALKEHIRRAIPLLQALAGLLQVALAVHGVAMPVAKILGIDGEPMLHSKYLQDAADHIGSLGDASASASAGADAVTVTSDDVKLQLATLARSPEGTREAYDAVRSLLERAGHDVASIRASCGLQQVVHQGRVGWIAKGDGAAMEAFLEGGQ